jgi:D-glycero-alpha-D-manno-heptose-7-phosphate kinase
LLKGKLNQIGEILDFGFEQKSGWRIISATAVLKKYMKQPKKPAQWVERSAARGRWVYDFLLSGNTRYAVIETLKSFGGEVKNYLFTKYGLTT